MKLYITRHGKTQWNVEGRFQGAKNSDLVASGRRDARALHDYLINEHFDAVYTSPLGRAKETAQLIFEGRKDVSICEDKRLEEMNFGVFEGMKTKDIFEQYGSLYDNLWNHPERFTRCPGGGESFEEVHQRVASFLADMEKLPEDAKVFIVTHGMYFVCLSGYLKGLALKDYPEINRYIVRGCSLTIANIDHGKYDIEVFGDDHYLVKEEKTSFLIEQKKDAA